jgi:hypothetical protein
MPMVACGDTEHGRHDLAASEGAASIARGFDLGAFAGNCRQCGQHRQPRRAAVYGMDLTRPEGHMDLCVAWILPATQAHR